jgi:hypothetical protein
MRIVLSIVMLIIAGIKAHAQMNGSVQATAMVYPIQSLTIIPKVGVTSISSPNDYVNGVTTNSYAEVKIKSNNSWILTYAAQSQYFTAQSQNGSTNMPSTVLSLKPESSSVFVPLTTQSKTLVMGNRGSNTDKHNFDIDINFNPGFKYNGGLYTISILYTLTKQ